MTRKTTHFQPELNSLLRLGHRVNKVKGELNDANEVKALDLAKGKILDSPNTNKNFKKTVAKRVEFGPEEKLFNKLTSLDLSEVELKPTSATRVKNVPEGKRDPEPCLNDFHEPFHGEPVPMMADPKDMRDKIVRDFYKADDQWVDQFLAKRNKFQDRCKK